jgi:hypothetical protein
MENALWQREVVPGQSTVGLHIFELKFIGQASLYHLCGEEDDNSYSVTKRFLAFVESSNPTMISLFP